MTQVPGHYQTPQRPWRRPSPSRLHVRLPDRPGKSDGTNHRGFAFAKSGSSLQVYSGVVAVGLHRAHTTGPISRMQLSYERQAMGVKA